MREGGRKGGGKRKEKEEEEEERGLTKTAKMEVKMLFLTRGNRWGN